MKNHCRVNSSATVLAVILFRDISMVQLVNQSVITSRDRFADVFMGMGPIK